MDVSLDRRELLAFGLSAAGCCIAGHSQAARFVDRTGLSGGRFIWEPTQPPEGPVVILVSIRDRLVHVYKNGTIVGISKCRLTSRRVPSGVFVLDGPGSHKLIHQTSATPPSKLPLAWAGSTLHATDLPRGRAAGRAAFRLPPDFAGLLAAVIQPGTLVISANSRTTVREVIHSGFLSEAGRAQLPVDSGRLGQLGLGLAGMRGPRPSKVTTIVISGADRRAALLHDGLTQVSVPVVVSDPGAKLGTHICNLLGADRTDSSFRWTAVAIAKRRRDPLLATSDIETVLSRIAFANPPDGVAYARELHIGASLIVSDLPVNRVQNRPPREQLILASDPPRQLRARRPSWV